MLREFYTSNRPNVCLFGVQAAGERLSEDRLASVFSGRWPEPEFKSNRHFIG